MALHSACLKKNPWMERALEELQSMGVAGQARLADFTYTYFLLWKVAAHSVFLLQRIPEF